MPDLVQVVRKFEKSGAEALLLSFDTQISEEPAETVRERVEKFVGRRGWNLPVLVYSGDYDALNERYDLPGPIPVTLAIDARGQVVDRQEGAASAARFEAMLKKALGKS
jgi:hypothetical protein